MNMSVEMIGNGTMYVGDNLDVMRTMKDRSVDLSIASPPYEGQRTYGIDFELIGQDWVDWMRPRVVEACRVTDGLVFVNMASPVRDYKYSPAVEWLVADLTRKDGIVCGPSPYAWFKMENRDDASANGIPGSGGPCYQRRDWEPLYAFAFADRLPPKWSDNKAFGTPPKVGSFGGEFSNRDVEGKRANAKTTTRSNPLRPAKDKTIKGSHGDLPCEIANPGNIIRAPVGGGKLGHPLAHETDAPFSTKLVERFVAWFCPPGGVVLDFFMGGGTTAQVAEEMQRRWIGIDVRPDQADLVRERLASVTIGLFA